MFASTPTPADARVRVLGPVRVAGRKNLGALSANAVLSLALARAHTRSIEALIADVWPLDPPAAARQALQTLISRLRSGTDRPLIETVPGGYRLAADALVDLDAVERLVTETRGHPDCHPFGPPHTTGTPHTTGATHTAGATPTAEATPTTDATPTHATHSEPQRIAALTASALAAWGEPVGGGASNDDLVRELTQRADAAHRALTLRLAQCQLALGLPDEALATLAAVGPVTDDAVGLTMRAEAAAGRPGDALRTFAAHRARLADELGTDPASALVALNTELLRAAAEPAPAVPPRVGLRRPATALVGRDSALSDLTDLLARHRLVTVLGVGGLGKTRIAFELAHRHDGAVVLIELAGIRDGADVDRAVASAIVELDGPRPRTGQPGETDSLDAMVEALAHRPTLLVLDNCEHVQVDAGRLTAALLERVPTLRVLTTSRKALGIAGEQLFRLAPLPSVDDTGGTGPAARLFCERARAQRADAALPRDQVIELTERLDGLPLAIELAAARIRSMSVAEISRRLADRFALLTIGDPTAPERHRTLRAVIDWSWDLLTASQRELGRRLSAFTGSFDADGAIALAGGRPPLAVLDDLDALVSHSLVKAFESPATRTTRYRMVQTVHEYCADQAAAAGEDAAIRDALFAWARQRAHTMIDVMVGAAEPLRVSLQEEEDNLVSALRLALAAADGATSLAVFGAAGMWWLVQGAFSELLALSEEVLGVLRGTPTPPGSEQDACLAASLIAFTQGFAPQLPADVDARPIVRELLAGGAAITPAIRFLAEVVLVRDEPDGMSTLSAQHETDPDPAVRALSRMLVASFAENTGEMADALRFAQEGYDVAVAERLWWLRAVIAQLIAGLFAESGQFEDALHWSETAQTDLARVGGRAGTQDLLQIEALGALRRGDLDAARAALARWRPIPSDRQPETDLMMRTTAAEVELAAGDRAAAVAAYDRALTDLDGRIDRLEPWWMIATAARITVRLDAGLDDDETAAILADLRAAVAASPQTSTSYADFPVTGTVALAFAAWYRRRAPAAAAGPELIALAERLQSRQDIPSMERARHAAAWDAERLSRARSAVAALAPADRLARTLSLIADPSHR